MKKIVFVLLLVLFGCTSKVSTTDASSPDAAKESLKPAPEFELENVAGGEMKSSDIKGKVAIVDFWATWCAPCIQEIPNFNEIHEVYKDKGVQIPSPARRLIESHSRTERRRAGARFHAEPNERRRKGSACVTAR